MKGGSLFSLSIFPLLFLLTGGPYSIAVYAATIFALFVLFPAGKIRDKRGSMILLFSSFFSTFLYFLSNHYAVYEYAGAESISLKEVLLTKMTFVLKFFGFGFSSLLFSGENLEEWLRDGTVQGKELFLLGSMILLFFLIMALLFLKDLFFGEKEIGREAKQSTSRNHIVDNSVAEKKLDRSLYGLFPALLLLHGLLSFALVFLSRYIFLRPEYAVQSRYALQYQSALLGALLLLYLRNTAKMEDKEIKYAEKKCAEKKSGTGKVFLRIFSIAITLLFLGGTLHTAKTEVLKAPYRRLHYETMLRSVHRIEEMSEEELENLYEYRHGKERILKAFSILKERKLNCFYEK